MINFDELRIRESEVLGKEQWNGLLDDTRRYFEGNVGLGTGSPKAKLHIKGEGGTNVDLLVNGRMRSDNNRGGLWISDDRFVGGRGTNRIGFFNKSWRLEVQNNGNVDIMESLDVRKNLNVRGGLNISGNTGIGTSNPMCALSLGRSLNTLKLALYQNNAGTSWYGMGVTSGHFYFNIGNANARYVFLDRAGSGAKRIFTIRGNGNVGIGNDNPGARLHVNGNIRANLRNIGSQRNARYNTTSGELGYETSTRRDKLNITPLKDYFGKIMQLQPREYTRPEDPQNLEIGYIAEEAKFLGLDHLIFYDENNRPDGINYEKLCLYLVEIVREHERKLNPDSPYLKKYIDESGFDR
jgi:hypothetical protein